MDKLLETVKEASISVACLLDDVAITEDNVLNGDIDLNKFLLVLEKDIEHIQDQITIIENFLEPFTVAELQTIREDKIL
jgi:hypothetical protein